MIKAASYTYKNLGREIQGLNEIASPHSIVMIKDTFEPYSNRFLVYEDTDWKCRLFPNYKRQGNEAENIAFIREKLSHELKIPAESIVLEKKARRIHEKYSVRHQCDRVYEHTFYLAKIQEFPEIMQRDTFMIDGRKYAWMTLDAMKQDAAIREHNLDIVEMVETFVP